MRYTGNLCVALRRAKIKDLETGYQTFMTPRKNSGQVLSILSPHSELCVHTSFDGMLLYVSILSLLMSRDFRVLINLI